MTNQQTDQPTSQPLLQLIDVTKYFGGLAAVSDVSFAVSEGQVHGLIGPNGAGKTTLLNLVSGLEPLTSGDIRFRGRSVAGMPAHAITELGVARTYQNIRLFSDMTVEENVLLGHHSRIESSWLSAVLALPRQRQEERAIRQQANALLAHMDMQQHRRALADELAYGDQRRVEIARALASEPKLLLLDEPSAGMNVPETAQLGQFILALRDQSITIMIVEHDMKLISQVCDQVVVLNFGRVISQGTPERVQSDPAVIEAYLGEDE